MPFRGKNFEGADSGSHPAPPCLPPPPPQPVSKEQIKSRAELRDRVCRFSARDLVGTLSDPSGGLRPEANQEHIDNALRLLGLAKGHFIMPGGVRKAFVGYLAPDSLGEVTITVQGVPVDKLTPSSARRVLSKISGPTPVKIEISHEGEPLFHQAERPVVMVKRDKKF